MIDALAAALRSGGARLLDVHADEDHNRSVFTLVGSGDALVESLLAGIARAAELIDLRRHEGAPPPIGAGARRGARAGAAATRRGAGGARGAGGGARRRAGAGWGRSSACRSSSTARS